MFSYNLAVYCLAIVTGRYTNLIGVEGVGMVFVDLAFLPNLTRDSKLFINSSFVDTGGTEMINLPFSFFFFLYSLGLERGLLIDFQKQHL